MNWTLISVLIIVFFKALTKGRRSGGSHLYHDGTAITAANDLIFIRLVAKFNHPTRKSTGSERSLSEIGYSFITLLRHHSLKNCSDPRDKIYSILSLTGASFSKALQPDYSKPARLIYVAAVRTYINISKKLDILGCATEESSASYPSWCPSWNVKPPSRIQDISPRRALYTTSGTTEAVAAFSKDESTIYLEGFLLCAIVNGCFQDSQKPFTYRKDAGVQSNWDVRLMAHNFRHVRSLLNISPSKDDPEFSADESEEQKCFNTVATTLLSGYWGNRISSPPVKKDIETGEW